MRNDPAHSGGTALHKEVKNVSRNRRAGWAVAGLAAAAVALGTVGVAVAPLALAQTSGTKAKAARGKARGNVPPPKKGPVAADPLAAPAKEKDKEKDKDAVKPAEGGTYHFRMRIRAFDDAPLTASYYPAKLETASPVVLLVHEKDRSSKDFEDPVEELKKQGMAEHLQGLGYAVLSFDLRGHGANARKALSDREWAEMVDDLQAVYQFLVDRHNRGELNVAKLGVVAVGEGANLAAAWAYLPGGAVSHEGRVTDIAALALVSPLPQGEGYSFSTPINSLAPRIPILLTAGERDAPSHDAVKKVRANVEKTRQNRVELFPSALHGYKLLKLEPRAGSVITKFLESTVKLKSTEWEPRYNLSPVAYTDIEVIRHAKPGDKEKEQEKAKEEAPKAKEKAGEPAARKDEAK
jgi:hypothetical protein